MSRILVTGTAGFIGFNLAKHLSDQGLDVIGLDNLSASPDSDIKYARLAQLGFNENEVEYNELIGNGNCRFIMLDLNDDKNLNKLFEEQRFTKVIHLAAQTGVRHSVENPLLYIDNNVRAFCSLLECCKNHGTEHFTYASSSSVYGAQDKFPFDERDSTDAPLSVYAASKKSNELIAHAYSSLYGLPTLGLRFFTVYGPWARTDMAVYLFMKAIDDGTAITLFNDGTMYRDFTYVDDVVNTIGKLIDNSATLDLKDDGGIPFQIFNVGNNKPVMIIDLIKEIEKVLKKQALIQNKPLQPGEMLKTFADTAKLHQYIDYVPDTDLSEGIAKTAKWYTRYKKQWARTVSSL